MNLKNIFANVLMEKAIHAGLIFGVFLIGLFFGRMSVHSLGSLIEEQLKRYHDGVWVVKVNGEGIGKGYLDERFDTYLKIHAADGAGSPFSKEIMLKKLIDNFIVLSAVDRAGLYRSTDFKKHIWFFVEEAIVSYYVDCLHRLKAGDPMPLNNEDKIKFYEAHRYLFADTNMSQDECLKIIDKQVENLSQRTAEKNRMINQRIELGKLKKESKIEINEKYIQESGHK